VKLNRIAIALMCTLASAGAWAAESVSVGVARMDITPDYPVRLNGFGFRREESAGVRQPIWAKALAIDDAGQDAAPLVLITVDALAIPDRLTRQLAEQLTADGVRPERLAVMATHTHTAPMINDVSPTIFGLPIPPDHQAHIDRYSGELAAKLLQVARAALQDRRPGRLSWGLGRATFAANRRTAGGPVDHDLPLLAVHDAAGQLRAVWVNYACHCVTLSDNLISGDWAGYAQSEIERLHPGCTALVSIGCGADANPSSGVTGDRADVAQGQGAEIATEVARLLRTPLTRLAPPVVAQRQRIRLPLAPLPTRERWQEQAERDDAVGFHARTQLARLDRGEALLSEIDYPIQTWRFGDELAMVFLPGEVVVDYALRVKRELDSQRVWMNAYANHCPGYVPSERILREGGYEGGGAMVYYDIPGPYAPGLEQRIVDVVVQQAGSTFQPTAEKAQGSGTQGSLPKSPTESIGEFQVADGLGVELVASEPLVTSPVAIAFGLRGELWVAEMFDYPSGVDGQYGAGGRIKRLIDVDHDGRFDEATVFLDKIPFPTGVTVWRDGLLVCAAPDVLFARDTDGDGRADDVRKLFHGFGTGNYQGRVNSLEYGLDGWVYGSCGLFGGTISTPDGRELALGDRDFRILPDEAVIEAATGRTQQGRVRDDSGQWFGCTNGYLLFHYPLADHDLRRNPHLMVAMTSRPIVADADAGRLFPRSTPVLFELSGPPGRVTAACGLGIYRDDYLGDEYQGDAFICEPVNNLVTRRRLVPHGSSFQACRAEDEANSEFLTSTDVWFRPVQVRTGSDGALWIVDMYRYVIEHPIWIPPETLARLDVRAGATRGRIYRVVRRDQRPRKPRYAEFDSPAACVHGIDSPNGTWRDLATQQILWNRDAWREPCSRLLTSLYDQTTRPLTRLHVVTLLDQLTTLSPQLLTTALGDADARVRRDAVRVAERYSSDAGVLQAMLEMADDADAHVRLQLACSLGNVRDRRAAAVLVQLLAGAPDEQGAEAVYSSLTADNLVDVLRAALEHDARSARVSDEAKRPAIEPERVAALFRLAGAMGDADAVACAIEHLEVSLASDKPLSGFTQFAQLLSGLANRSALPEPDRLDPLLAVCRQRASDERADSVLRIGAVHVLAAASSRRAEVLPVILALLDPRSPLTLQYASIDALERLGGDDVPIELFRKRAALSPTVQEKAMSVLLSRVDWTGRLLDEIRAGNIVASDLSLVQHNQLLQHQDAQIRQRAAELLAPKARADRQQLVELYSRPPLPVGDARRGQQVFVEKCSACHLLSGQGRTLGPDIAIYGAKPLDALLIAVLDPNQAVDPRYQQYSAVTTDGRILSGVVSDETTTGLVLTDAEGTSKTLLRSEIESLQRLGSSLMPEGLERELSPAAIQDLFAYLKVGLP
jgi:putative membrane-bound dehydrogenase-like protein